MKIIEVIPFRQWVNSRTGQTASIYGAVPYVGDNGDWSIVQSGYTWRNDNGTVGLGRKPMPTRELAERFMVDFNNRDWDKMKEYAL